MTEQKKREIIEEAFNYYHDRTSLTNKEEEELLIFVNELYEAITVTHCCDKLMCKEDKTSEILEKLKECTTQITELNAKYNNLEFTISGKKLKGVLKDR